MISAMIVILFLLVFQLTNKAIEIILVASFFALLLNRFPRFFKYAYIQYILSLVLVGVSLLFYDKTFTVLITNGIISYGLFLLVMYIGVFPNKWTFTRVLKKNRGEFSIMGFLLIIPHVSLHLFEVFPGINLFGIAAFVLMIPVTLVSFKVIKREIDPKDWLLIQKTAYVIYTFLFIHVFMVAVWQHKVIYTILFVIYVNNRIMKVVWKNEVTRKSIL